MKLITVPEARRDFVHGLVCAFEVLPLPEGRAFSVLVRFAGQRDPETLRAVNADRFRLFRTLDAALSAIQQIAATEEFPRLVAHFAKQAVEGPSGSD